MNVNAIPFNASGFVFATLNLSLLPPSFITNNSVPAAKVPPAVVIPATDTPSKVEPGEYIIFSPLSKK